MPISIDDPRLQRCGFAKLQGENFEFYIRKYETAVGRKSKSASLDVVLAGDNMNISRKHAVIIYNFEKGHFELEVLGKNGVTIQGVLHTPGSGAIPLNSRDLIQLGDRSFYFLLPRGITQGTRPTKRQRLTQSREVSRGDGQMAAYNHLHRPESRTYPLAYDLDRKPAASREGYRPDVGYNNDTGYEDEVQYKSEQRNKDDRYRHQDAFQEEKQYKQEDGYQYNGVGAYQRDRYTSEEAYGYRSNEAYKGERYKTEDNYPVVHKNDSYEEDEYKQADEYAQEQKYNASRYPRGYSAPRSPAGPNGQFHYSNDYYKD